MFALHRHRLIQRRPPDVHRLAGNCEHQIEIDVFEAGAAQGVEGFEDHLARVDAAQPVEQRRVERLHAHGNAVDAEVAEELGLVGGDRGRVAFHRELVRAEQVQLFHGPQYRFPLAQVQQRRGAAAKKNGLRPEIMVDEFEFADQGGGVAIHQFAAGGLRIEGAIHAFLCAERDVNVKAGDATGVGIRHGARVTSQIAAGE